MTNILKKFNARYAELIAEQSVPRNESSWYIRRAEGAIYGRFSVSYIEEHLNVDLDDLHERIYDTLKTTEAYLKAAVESGKPVDLYEIYKGTIINELVENDDREEGLFKVRETQFKSYAQGAVLEPTKGKALCDYLREIRRADYEEGKRKQREREEQRKRDEEERVKQKAANEAVIKTPEFKAFKDAARSAGFQAALGAGLEIGKNVPKEFFSLFAQQTDKIKKAFIQYVLNYNIDKPNSLYADHPQYSRESQEWDERDAVRKAFARKLQAML